MNFQISLDTLWNSERSLDRNFQPSQIVNLPEIARLYLEHAIAPNTPLASAVRLKMHGEIKLKQWYPFTAEQVIHRDRGMIWQATVKMNGIPIKGSDRLIDSEGSMQWKILGLIPMMTASGADITRSAIGRVQAESMWLPSVFCDESVSWTTTDASHLLAHFNSYSTPVSLTFGISNLGHPQSIKLQRWGNPEGAEFHNADFGGIVEQENTFGGYTIPTRLRVGWYYGSERFESEGEFFRVTIDDAIYR
jgi:hypothetical protein